MIAANVMSTKVQSLNQACTVKDAMKIFQNSVLNDFPVVDDDNKPVGIVTARSILHFAVPSYASDNLLAAMASGPDIESVYKNLEHILDHPIKEVLDTNFKAIKSHVATSAVAAMLTSLEGSLHNILVVDDDGTLAGVISARDILCRQPYMEKS